MLITTATIPLTRWNRFIRRTRILTIQGAGRGRTRDNEIAGGLDGKEGGNGQWAEQRGHLTRPKSSPTPPC